jgi:hypothetical protein
MKTKTRTVNGKTTIPLERGITLTLGEFFGRSLQNKVLDDDGANLTHVQDLGASNLEYIFDKEMIKDISKQLKRKDEASLIRSDRQITRMWLTLIVMSFEQHDQKNYFKIGGGFTYQDIFDKWGVEDGNESRKTVQDAIASLYTGSFIYTKNIAGNKIENAYVHPISKFSVVERKTGSRAKTGKLIDSFRFELHEDALGITKSWIRDGKLSKAEQKEGYLPYKAGDVRGNFNMNYVNFKERLRMFKGGKVGGQTVLMKWIKLSGDKLNRRAYCKKELVNCLERAKNECELADYAADLPEVKGWIDSWTVCIDKA